MYREKIKELEEWKDSKDRMPLIIRGARQVGKTWIMKEFRKIIIKRLHMSILMGTQEWPDYLKETLI